MFQGCVAVKYLSDDHMNCINWVKHTVAPGAFLLAAGGVDRRGVEVERNVFSEQIDDINQAVMQLHRRVSQDGIIRPAGIIRGPSSVQAVTTNSIDTTYA
jgi:hypothetical protein